MLNLRDGTYYGLDEVGAEIWRLIQTPITIGRIVASLVDMYDVDARTLPHRRHHDSIAIAARASTGGSSGRGMSLCRARLNGFPAVAAFVAGSPRQWSDLQISEDALLELCSGRGSRPPCAFTAVSQSRRRPTGPRRCARLSPNRARAGRRRTAARRGNPRGRRRARPARGVSPILIKGTPLAYTVYDAPALRPREDTDLLIAPADVEAARARAGCRSDIRRPCTAAICFRSSRCRRSIASVCATSSTCIGRSARSRSSRTC